MTVSSHHHLKRTPLTFLGACARRLLINASKVALLSVASLIFVSQAMATDALDREHAIEIAKEQNGEDGKVLGVAIETDSDGITRFAVKLLSNGRVRVFNIVKAP